MKNYLFLRHPFSRLCVLLFAIVWLAGCSKEKIPPIKSDKAEILSFSFGPEANPSLTTTYEAIKNGLTLFVTVPEEVNLASLKPKIVVSEKASATINGTPANAPQSHNFSGVVKVEVTSEMGSKFTYRVVVKNGRREIDNLIYNFMERYSIPGISVGLAKNERIIYNHGFGFAINENDTRTTKQHLFRLASVSKQFTTLCIMKLYEAGKLKITDKVFGQGGILEKEFEGTFISAMASRVTVQHLLEHTAGWVTSPDPMFTSSFKGQTLDQRIKYVLASEQVEPASKYGYFNMGFGILGRVIEKLSGKNFETYLKEVLLEAGITDIHVGKDRSGRRDNEVVYYSQDGTNGYANEMEVIAAAGGVIASSDQMLNLLFRIDGLTGIPDIIKPQTRAMMLTPSSTYNRYALGWRTNHTYFPDSYYHSGNLAGTAAMWVMGPNVNCVVLCNSRSYITGFDDELFGLLRSLFEIAKAANW